MHELLCYGSLSANNMLNVILPVCSRQFWSTEDGFLVAGETSLWKIYNPAKSLLLYHPPLSKIVKEALGGGFGPRSVITLR